MHCKLQNTLALDGAVLDSNNLCFWIYECVHIYCFLFIFIQGLEVPDRQSGIESLITDNDQAQSLFDCLNTDPMSQKINGSVIFSLSITGLQTNCSHLGVLFFPLC